MKRIILGTLIWLLILGGSYASSGIIGDINGDGQVGLQEALFALKVAAGQHPGFPDTCVLTGRGVWEYPNIYNECDVVSFNEEFFVAIKTTNKPPWDEIGGYNTNDWSLLKLDAKDGISCWDLNGNGSCDVDTEDGNSDTICDALDCQGPEGPQGPRGLQGPQGPAGEDGQVTPELQEMKDDLCKLQLEHPEVNSHLSTYCPSKYIFVTSEKGTGQLSTWSQTSLDGPSGADEVCQSEAQNAGLQGIYKAWISDGNLSPLDRLEVSSHDIPYILVDRRVVVNRWDNFTSNEGIRTPINLTASGQQINSNDIVWTNIRYDGTSWWPSDNLSGIYECGYWANNTNFANGRVGLITNDTSWTGACVQEFDPPCEYRSCDSLARLYCMEQ